MAGCVKALTWYGERWPGPVSRRQVATSGAVLFVTWGAMRAENVILSAELGRRAAIPATVPLRYDCC